MDTSNQTALPQRSRRSALLLRLILALLVGIVCAVTLFAYTTWPASASDQQEALELALNSLIDGAQVDTPDGPTALEDRDFVLRARGHIYFINETSAGDSVFLAHGLKRVPPGKQIDVGHGDVVVRASYQRQWGARARPMQFSYVFGSVGGHSYDIRVNRGVGGRRILFVHAWVS